MPIKQIIAAGLFLGLSLLSITLPAQDYRKGYVIKSNGDSISGYVQYTGRKNNSRCDFKSSKRSGRTSFNPSELIAYGFADGRRYVSVTLPVSTQKELVFARILANGPLKLYSYSKTFYIKKDSVVRLPVPKGKIVGPVEEGGAMMEKKDKRYVAILNQFLLTVR